MVDAQGAWADWLRTMRWNFWATGMFGKVSETLAQQHIHEWLNRLERIRAEVYEQYDQEHYRPARQRVYAAYSIEWGPMQGNIHVHMLVGGLGGHPSIHHRARTAWSFGQMHIVRYDPDRDPVGQPKSGAAAYLRKTPDADVHLVGKLQRYRPRRGKAM